MALPIPILPNQREWEGMSETQKLDALYAAIGRVADFARTVGQDVMTRAARSQEDQDQKISKLEQQVAQLTIRH